MATISKHGGEIGRIERLTDTLCYCADGALLINRGDGWRLYHRKKFEDIERVFREDKQIVEGMPHAWHAFKDALHEIATLPDRMFLFTALKQGYTDPDGLWSDLNELCKLKPSYEEVDRLCMFYRVWRLHRETMPFAVLVSEPGLPATTLVGIVQGDAEFRRSQYARLRSVYGTISTRLAAQHEINAYVACRNKITRQVSHG